VKNQHLADEISKWRPNRDLQGRVANYI